MDYRMPNFTGHAIVDTVIALASLAGMWWLFSKIT